MAQKKSISSENKLERPTKGIKTKRPLVRKYLFKSIAIAFSIALLLFLTYLLKINTYKQKLSTGPYSLNRGYQYPPWYQYPTPLAKSPTSKPITPTESPPPVLPEVIGDVLSSIFSGNIEMGNYPPNSGFHWGEEGFDLSASVSVYKYSPGTKVNIEYYGHSKEYDLDQEISTIKSLSYGKNIALIEGPFDGIDNLKTEVIYKKIGSRDYGYYHQSFAPAATDGRIYFTYDEVNNFLIYIRLYFYSTGNNLELVPSELDNNIMVKVFPQKYQNFLTNFEENYLAKY